MVQGAGSNGLSEQILDTWKLLRETTGAKDCSGAPLGCCSVGSWQTSDGAPGSCAGSPRSGLFRLCWKAIDLNLVHGSSLHVQASSAATFVSLTVGLLWGWGGNRKESTIIDICEVGNWSQTESVGGKSLTSQALRGFSFQNSPSVL